MNAKDCMIEYQNQESPWLTLAKRLVREDRLRRAALKGEQDEGVQRVEVSQASGIGR